MPGKRVHFGDQLSAEDQPHPKRGRTEGPVPANTGLADVVNYYKIIPKQLANATEYFNPNAPVIPPHPTRMLIVGPSGKGKTDLLLNFIFKADNFDHIYIVAKSPKQPLLKYLKAKLGDKLTIYDRIDELPPVEEIKDENPKQILVVFDDCVMDKKMQPKICDYFVRGRPKNCSVCYITQSYFATPKTCRLQTSHVIMLRASNKKDLKMIVRDHAMDTEDDQVYEMYKDAVNQKDTEIPFFLIDTSTNNPNLRFRKGFGEAYVIEPEEDEVPHGDPTPCRDRKKFKAMKKDKQGADDVLGNLKEEGSEKDKETMAEVEDATLEQVARSFGRSGKRKRFPGSAQGKRGTWVAQLGERCA